MKIDEAVATIVAQVKSTRHTLAQVVPALWRTLNLSDASVRQLAQEALSSRASQKLTRPALEATKRPVTSRSLQVEIQHIPRPVVQVDVDIQILDRTVYHVNGVAKPVLDFTLFDVHTKLAATRSIESGVSRHRQLWEYIERRLTQLHKTKVSDLAFGELHRIAKMLEDIKDSKEIQLPAEVM